MLMTKSHFLPTFPLDNPIILSVMQHTTYEMCISHSIHDPEVHPMGPLFCFDCCSLFLWTPFTLSASKANITELQCPFSTVCPDHLFALARS